MRYEDLYVSAVGSWLPPKQTAEEALRDGLCEAEVVARTDVAAVTVAGDEAPPDMAVRAARTALDRAAAGPDDIDLILHATGYYQGHDSWAVPSYVQRETLGNGCPAVEIRQMSNGSMAGLELAAGYLSAGGRRGALLTAADRFCPPRYDRWRSDPGTPMGDGGSAMVLRRGDGFARLVSVATWSEPRLEGMHRGDDPFGVEPFGLRDHVDTEVCKRAFVSRFGLSRSVQLVNSGHRKAVTAALADAGWELADVDRFVLPNLGRRRMEVNYFRLFGIDPARTTWEWGRQTGHMGAADQFAGLEHLVREGALQVGSRCLLLGMGAGFTWSCACLEIVATPAWA